MKPFAGIYTPIATPFRDDGDVDERALAANVARWMTTPLTGLVVLGSNGEAASSRTRKPIASFEIVRDGVPVLPTADRRDRPRVHPRHHRRDSPRGGRGRRCRRWFARHRSSSRR